MAQAALQLYLLVVLLCHGFILLQQALRQLGLLLHAPLRKQGTASLIVSQQL